MTKKDDPSKTTKTTIPANMNTRLPGHSLRELRAKRMAGEKVMWSQMFEALRFEFDWLEAEYRTSNHIDDRHNYEVGIQYLKDVEAEMLEVYHRDLERD